MTRAAIPRRRGGRDRAARASPPTSWAGASISRRIHSVVAGAPPRMRSERRARRDRCARWPPCGRAADPVRARRERWRARGRARGMLHRQSPSVSWVPTWTFRRGVRCHSGHCCSARDRAALWSRPPMRRRCWRSRASTVCQRDRSVPCGPKPRELRITAGATRVVASLERLAAAYHGAIPGAMGIAAVVQAAEEPTAAGSFV